jgi:hypothetical protein
MTCRQDYEKWVLAKMDLLIEGKKIQEVFDYNVPEYELFKLLQENKGKRRILFEGYFLPRDTENLIGMTIFRYANNCREIFFGWDLKHSYFEPVFRTKNQEVVEFFLRDILEIFCDRRRHWAGHTQETRRQLLSPPTDNEQKMATR